MDDHEDSHDKCGKLIDVEFSLEEKISLKQMATWWVRIGGALALGGVVGSIAKWTVLMIAFIAAIKAGLAEWLIDGLSK